MTDPACGLCNVVMTIRGCPVHHPLQWQVETITAYYTIDMDQGIVVRTRRTEPLHADWPDPSDLRLDGEPMELIALLLCQVGVGMEMLVQIRDDGVVTVRATTPVAAIRAVLPGYLPAPRYLPYAAPA